jgi:hypothetical protein
MEEISIVGLFIAKSLSRRAVSSHSASVGIHDTRSDPRTKLERAADL